MTKFSRSAISSFLLVLTFVFVAAQVWAASEGPRPVIKVATYSPLGFTTFRIDRLSPVPFTASWEMVVGGPNSKADLYVGMLSPGAKTAYTWVRRNGSYVLLKGMYPFMEGVSMNVPATYVTWDRATGDLKYTPTGHEEMGMYLVFALVVGAGKDPGETTNWAEVEMKPLFVTCPILNPQC